MPWTKKVYWFLRRKKTARHATMRHFVFTNNKSIYNMRFCRSEPMHHALTFMHTFLILIYCTIKYMMHCPVHVRERTCLLNVPDYFSYYFICNTVSKKFTKFWREMLNASWRVKMTCWRMSCVQVCCVQWTPHCILCDPGGYCTECTMWPAV